MVFSEPTITVRVNSVVLSVPPTFRRGDRTAGTPPGEATGRLGATAGLAA